MGGLMIGGSEYTLSPSELKPLHSGGAEKYLAGCFWRHTDSFGVVVSIALLRALWVCL